MRTATRLLLALLLWAGVAAAADAKPTLPAPPAAQVQSAIADVLNGPDRLPLPLGASDLPCALFLVPFFFILALQWKPTLECQPISLGDRVHYLVATTVIPDPYV